MDVDHQRREEYSKRSIVMGRYIGPVCKLCRREGEKLYLKGDRCDSPKCGLTRRPYPPGKSGVVRKKISDYGIRLREKQKAKRFYGLTEKQFRITYSKATRKKGVKGELFLKALELRFDNAVYRIGLATTRMEARQLVRHGHFLVNGRKVDIPSYNLKVGDEIKIAEASASVFATKIELMGKRAIPAWLVFDAESKTAKVNAEPVREDIDAPVNEQLIVEFYSR